jgi:putative addiction module component (TIGR02574 family)
MAWGHDAGRGGADSEPDGACVSQGQTGKAEQSPSPLAPHPVDNRPRRDHAVGMASSERVQRALAAASALTTEERAELIGELILSLEREGDPQPGYDEAWSAEIRRRVDAVLSGASKGAPWSQVKSEIAAQLAERRRRSA